MQRIIIGMSGASGAIYGIRALEALKGVPDIETHLVLSSAAKRTIVEETDWKISAVEALADVVHTHSDMFCCEWFVHRWHDRGALFD
jgi:4-hydroxy-3-polyprenylbenzoate decarboxylase